MSKSKDKEPIPWRFLAPLLLGTMMNPLNSTMLATALATLCNAFKISTGQGAILITSLYVTATVAQPLMGRLADIYSARKVNHLGFMLVMAAALVGMFAPSFSWLVASRILLGLGTSAAYPSGMALLGKRYALEKRPIPGPVLGLMAVSAQVTLVLGPTLGGALTQWLGWRGIFIINVPWVIIGLLLSRALPDYPSANNDKKHNIFERLDIPGILIFCAFLGCLLVDLLSDGLNWYMIATTVFALIGLCLWERQQHAPFIDVRLLWRRPSLSLVYIRGIATSYILYLILYGLPQWMEAVRHLIPVHTGLIMLPNSITAIGSGLLIARVKNSKLQNVLGSALFVVSCCGIFFLNGQIALPIVVCIGMVAGFAEGTNIIANQSLLNEEAPLDQKGVSFGLYRTAAYIGAILSGTQLKNIFHNGVTDHSFHRISFFISIATGVLLLLLVPLAMNPSRPPQRREKKVD